MEQTTKTAEQVLQETFEHAYGTLHPLMHVQPILRAMEAYAAQRPTVAPSETKTACACKYPSYNAMTDRCTVCGKLYYKEQAAPVAPDYDCVCVRCNREGHAKEWHTVGLESHSGYGGDPICDECYKELIGEQATPVAEGAGDAIKEYHKWREALEKAFDDSEANDFDDFRDGAEWAKQHFEQQVTALQAENREQKLIISSMEDGCEQWQSLYSDLERDVADLKKELFKFSEQNQSLQAENAELRKQCDSKEKTR